MPTKKEILEKLESSPVKHYTTSMVRDLVHSVSSKGLKQVNYIKKGDVFITGAPKLRPNVVVSVQNDCCLCMSLSTTKDCMNIYESKSRFMGDGYFSKAIFAVPNYVIRENFIGVYDNPKRLNKAIEACKKYIFERI